MYINSSSATPLAVVGGCQALSDSVQLIVGFYQPCEPVGQLEKMGVLVMKMFRFAKQAGVMIFSCLMGKSKLAFAKVNKETFPDQYRGIIFIQVF